MAVYNGEAYLKDAVDSILEQEYADFEFIIINDASTDSSASILDSIEDQRIVRLRNAENVGLTKSLNVGLRVAKGEYIARMDADDISHPDRLIQQVEFLDRHPDHVLCGSSYRLINDRGDVVKTYFKPMLDLELRWVSHLRTPLEHASVTFRRCSPAGERYFYDERYVTAQDAEFWLRLLRDGKGCVLAPVLIDYRWHPQNVSSTRSVEQTQNLQQIALSNSAEMYALSETEIEDVRCLHKIYLSNANFHLEDFIKGKNGLEILLSNFVSEQNLDTAEARRIRSRAVGQFWNAVLAKQRRTGPAIPFRYLRYFWLGRNTLPDLARRLWHKLIPAQ